MIEVIDLGRKDYSEILELQKRLFLSLVESKKEGKNDGKEYLLLVEHNPVITSGRRAGKENILVSEDFLKKEGVELFKIERGGDVTFHEPGQLVAYPILDLDRHKLGVKDYVNLLEETIIRLLDNYGIKGERVAGATGVWIDKETSGERKICAIGIKCSRFCTMHGLALNVNNGLQGFSLINPCGFKDKGVTSIKEETGMEIDFDELKRRFSDIFLSLIFPFKEVFNFTE